MVGLEESDMMEIMGWCYLMGYLPPIVLTTDANYHLAHSCVAATPHIQRKLTATPGI